MWRKVYINSDNILILGQFDEIFFIGLPNQNERKKIFEVIIERFRKYNKKLLYFILNNRNYCFP